jgi:dUTP pyrophosphatase
VNLKIGEGIQLKVKKICDDAILPYYAHENDAGLDLFSVENKEIKPNESCLIRTGIKIELPETNSKNEFFEAQIRPRSGLALKYCITVLNSPGTIDYGYRGEIGVILINHGKDIFKVEKGMKIAQMVIQKVLKVSVLEVDELSLTQRNQSGFGSTGLTR